MKRKEIEQLIAYHQAGLGQYRQHMSPSAQILEEKTIKALREFESHMIEAILREAQEKRQ